MKSMRCQAYNVVRKKVAAGSRKSILIIAYNISKYIHNHCAVLIFGEGDHHDQLFIRSENVMSISKMETEKNEYL